MVWYTAHIFSRLDLFDVWSFWKLPWTIGEIGGPGVNDAGILYSGETETNGGNTRQLQLQRTEYWEQYSLDCKKTIHTGSSYKAALKSKFQADIILYQNSGHRLR